MPSRRPTLEAIVLFGALIGDVAVLFYGNDPVARVGLGLLLLAPIVWASARIGIVELVTRSPAERIYKRRFTLLRSQVQQLLDEIRRLNWIVVDAERGFRSRDKALREMDIIEGRLKELIQEIRTTAGQVSPESEVARASEGGETSAN